MKSFVRFTVLALVLTLVMGLGMATVSAQDETILVFGWEQEPQSLAPLADMTFSSLMLNFYGRDVWDWDNNREIYPEMVEAIPDFENGLVTTLENGNTQVTYKLRQDMLWSDGEPITAEDCQWYHDRVMMVPESGGIQRGQYPEVVESLVTVDDYTLVLTYNRPYPDYLSSSFLTCGFPQHVYEPALDEFGVFDDIPYIRAANVTGTVGYGPYVFESWSVGSEVVFAKNQYWDGQAPYFDRLVLRFIPDSSQMTSALEVGEIDIAFNFGDDQVSAYSALDGVEVFNTPGVYGDAIWMNVGNNEPGSPMEDVNVRKAIMYAIDRVALAEELVGPGTAVPKNWVPSQYWPEDHPILEYDPEMAAQLLDEAGWVDTNDDGVRDKDGLPLVLRFFTTDRQIRMDYQIFIQEYLAEVGISVQLFPVPAGILFGSFSERGILNTGDFDLAIFALSANALSPAYDAPDWYGCGGIPSTENPAGNNGWGSCDPEFDRLDLLVLGTVDPVERLGYAQEAQLAFFNMQFWHGLYMRPTWYAIDSAALDLASMQNVGTLVSNYFNQIEYWQPGM